MTYYAHTKGDDPTNWQTLKDHLTSTARLAAEFGQDAGVSELAYIAGIVHDLGKYSQAFQNRLKGAKQRVDHSTAGGKELLAHYPVNKLAELLAYCIVGHHAGLPDAGNSFELGQTGTLRARLNSEVEDYSAYKSEIDINALQLPTRLPIRPYKKQIHFSIQFLTRMVYSALVDADFQDTETFVSGKKPRGEFESIETLCERFNQFLRRFDNPQNEINRKRTFTLKRCIDMASTAPGFFTLTIPTGGGKTLASMAFALNHAVKHGLKRIIYVIPFTSIIEQNAAVFKECLGEEYVLEHHSNFDWDQTREREGGSANGQAEDAYVKLKLAAENWDIPVVVTTNVQFFESLFANRSSRCRKLHNLAKSVIIFDEAQMLPREYLLPSMAAVWELVTNYGASAVFCTATQPAVHNFLPKGTTLTELAPDPNELYRFYRRVQVTGLGRLTDDELLERLNDHRQGLCIVNTRRHAKGLYSKLVGEGRFHLSTLMCPVHRQRKLSEIRKRLQSGQPCRVVSTQVMEAGIDISFPVGYRALAGLDSIIQAGGRVNRESEVPCGNMYVFEPVTDFVKRTPAYIEQGAAVARSILHDFSTDPTSLEAINAYFEQLYYLQDPHAFDARQIMACFTDSGLNFESVAQRFRFIEDNTIGVIIPFDEQAEQWIDELETAQYPRSILRKLQIYTVNIFEPEYDALASSGAIRTVATYYPVLTDLEYYHSETGIIIPETPSGNALFI